MKKEELKLLIKECLLEILQEGVVTSRTKIRESVRTQSQAVTNKQAPVVPVGQPTDTMQMIFEDTARTTLMKQIDADRRPTLAQARNEQGTQTEEHDASGRTPQTQAVSSANRWETLAFVNAKKNGSGE